MKRRTFVGAVVAGSAAAIVGLWRSRSVLVRGVAPAAADQGRAARVEAIRSHFSDLSVSPEVAGRFLDDVERHELWSLPDDGLDLMSRFLLSTDHFEHGADPKRPVAYVGLYQPYLAPCRQPMQRRDV